nr:integrase, catalytic region, zinc finger, CCHC-type, peptidase aspartic, catalytic [Tanacetum cinerariifolium]
DGENLDKMKEKGDEPIFVGFDPAPECQNMALNHDSLSPAIQGQENVTQADRTVTTSNELDLLFNDEFINIFSTPVQDQGETSSRHVDSSNMQTFYHRYPSEHRWTKDHPLEQVIRNPSQSVKTRRQLESDAKMCMFALTETDTIKTGQIEAKTDKIGQKREA